MGCCEYYMALCAYRMANSIPHFHSPRLHSDLAHMEHDVTPELIIVTHIADSKDF